MKRLGSLFLTVLMVFTLAVCGAQASDAESATAQQQEPISVSEAQQGDVSDSTYVATGENNILIAYFSSAGNIAQDETVVGNVGNGNTKLVAELIQGQVGGDLFFIETVNKYPATYNDTIDVAMQELRGNARPTLASHVENMNDYDVIYLGYPTWWGTLPRAVLTFLEEYDFSGKTVIPFCTYEDSGVGRSIKDLEEMLPSTTLLMEFSVAERDLKDAEEAVKQWLSELNLAQ